MSQTISNAVNEQYTYATVPTQFVEANGIKFAYRSYGKAGDIPVIYFNHLTANLDNCDPRIMDAIAAHRQIISFDYRGVGASTGKQGTSIPDMASDAIAFIHTLGYKPTVNSYDMAKRFPNAQIKIYPNSGHGGIFQYHEEFIPQAIDFLTK